MQSPGNKFLAGEIGLCELLGMLLDIAAETSDFKLTGTALETLCDFVSGSCLNQERAGQCGICELVSELVGVGNGMDIDEKGLWCIAYLCRSGLEISTTNEGNAVRFGEKKMSVYIMNALKLHSKVDTVLQAGLTALGNMCCIESLTISIGSNNGCLFVTTLVQQNLATLSVAEAGIAAIDSMLVGNNINVLMELKICQLLMSFLRQYPEDRKITMDVCSCIRKISKHNPSSSVVFGQCGASMLLVASARRFEDDSVVIMRVLNAMNHISSQNSSNKLELGAVGVCELIIKLLKLYSTNNMVITAAAALTRTLTDKCPENLERMKLIGGLQLISTVTANSEGLWSTARGQLE
jgi:hypothetical protein